MNKVTTIHLNGKAYQLEEEGYAALKTYLDRAAAKLEGNPDKDEILADFERAIADKCDRRISKSKDVITTKEVSDILAEMGPVEGEGGPQEKKGMGEEHAGADAAHGSSASRGPRRLYQIRQGAWVTGVCNGIAAYFGMDVTLVRIIFIILALALHGWWIAVYVILMIVMPVAHTEAELAEAYGAPDWNAHDFISQAQKNFDEFRKTNDKREFKRRMREWKREFKARWNDEWRDNYRESMRFAHEQWHSEWQDRVSAVVAGIFAAIGGILIAILVLFWIGAIWSLAHTGMAFGFALGPAGTGQPLWVSIVFITALFYMISLPLRLLLRAPRYVWGGRRAWNLWDDVWSSIIFILALAAIVYTSVLLFPSFHAGWDSLVANLRMLVTRK